MIVDSLPAFEVETVAAPVIEQPAIVVAEPVRSRNGSFLERVATGALNLVVDSALLSAGAVIGSQVVLRIQTRRHPYPLPHQFAALLDHRVRLGYRKPDDTLGIAGFVAGMTVLDLGCGTGLFTEEMARIVGAQGLVHAVDLQQAMLNLTQKRLVAAGLADRCLLHAAGAYALPMESQSVDIAVMVATLGEIQDRLHALLELQRVVKPGGRLMISEEVLHPLYLTANGVKRLAEEAGFVMSTKSRNPLYHTAVFTRP